MNTENTQIDLSQVSDEQIEVEFVKRVSALGEVRFFYTEEKPYQWSSGRFPTTTGDNRLPFESMAAVAEEAASRAGGKPYTEDFVAVTFGMEITPPHRNDELTDR